MDNLTSTFDTDDDFMSIEILQDLVIRLILVLYNFFRRHMNLRLMLTPNRLTFKNGVFMTTVKAKHKRMELPSVKRIFFKFQEQQKL